ncbi:protease complex subunit PrcB family protein [Oceanobacter mangrovi]|uniref:protease complex subunit PrcB family protein n=1 Tax=Oceanobacter mangrovi TaxID=2862510 RepID=UPI001C8E272E|nr:protease complex subunit PrcB family protein [Oceanobacter mangrovi]
MTSGRISWSGGLLAMLLAVTGCAGTEANTQPAAEAVVERPQAQLTVVENLHCLANTGISLDEEQTRVRIALGSRPTAGYGVAVTAQYQLENGYEIHFIERKPAEGMAQAAVMTSPCADISLPDDWQALKVVNDMTGLAWHVYHSGR